MNLYSLAFRFSFLPMVVWFCGVTSAQPIMECNLTMPKELVFDSKIGDYVPNPFTVHSTLVNKIDSIPTVHTITWESVDLKLISFIGDEWMVRAMPRSRADSIEICVTYRVKNLAPILCCSKIWIPAALSTDVDSKKNNPNLFYLGQNYPNPFNQLTIVDCRLSDAKHSFRKGLLSETIEQKERASFKIYDVFGREVLDISNKIIDNSRLVIDNSQLPTTGIYFYRLTIGNESQTRMMTLIK